MIACIGEPISWPRLERHASGAHDAAIAVHIASCAACRECLTEIERDVVALPPLAVPAARPARRRWWWLAAPALAAAAAVAVLVLRPGRPENEVAIKGVGDVILGVVRDRQGALTFDARTFAVGDRWKVIVTCPPSASAWVAVSVADGITVDHPLAPAQLACGNEIAVPGAFSITGARDNRVCATIAASPTGAPGIACVTLRPE